MSKLIVPCIVAMLIGSSSASAQFTAAFWGDCRANSGNAFSEIAGYLLANRDNPIDVHWQNGDFTSSGTASDWNTSFGRTNVPEACVRDYFYMCTSNHDDGTEYQPRLRNILPSNGSNVYYYHVQWDIPGSSRKVHLCAVDLYMSSTSAQTTYFANELAGITDEDWLVLLWHNPSYTGMTYKTGNSMATNTFIPFFMSRGADFILNGHAHQYRRTHILAANGSVAESTGPSGTSHASSASDPGIVHIVNGRGGVFSTSSTGATWPGNAVAPTLNNSFGLVTLMEFDDATVNINTILIGDAYAQVGVMDTWSWTRGAQGTLAGPRVASPAIEGLQISRMAGGAIAVHCLGPVELSLHSLKGDNIGAIQVPAAGRTVWRPSDEGAQLTPGTYLVRARSGQNTMEQQVLLLP